LKAYNNHLSNTSKELQSQISSVQNEVDDYEADGKGMDQIATRYAELTSKGEKLQIEIEKLEK
jgi:DNA repair ATPase RecN